MPTLTKETITAAILGFEEQKNKIDIQIAELRAMLSGEPTATVAVEAKPGRRKFSAAAKKRMREAQQARWAKIRGETATEAPAGAKPKRKMSAAGRRAIAKAQRARWAAKK